MIRCLCGCPELDHALGEGICETCGCPAYRPVRVGTELDDDAHDLIHQAAVDGLLAEHKLTTDMWRTSGYGVVVIELPELPEDPA